MSEFKKYMSIENHYRDDHIDYFLEIFPKLEHDTFVITEKLHGANICLIIEDDILKVASRNRVLEGGESFYDIWNVLDREEYKCLVESVKNHCKGKQVSLYGELIGKGIQKGVDYGEEKRLLFFDIAIDGMYLSQKEFMHFVFEYFPSVECSFVVGPSPFNLCVPSLGKVVGLKTALDFNTNFNSKILNIEDNICEGVVIKPYETVYPTGNGRIFYLKKKNGAFKEKQKTSKIKKDPKNDYSEEVQNLHAEFLSYITKNRLDSVFSKYGKISSMNDMGKYIQLMMEDAKEDFMKDTGFKEEKCDKPNKKYIFNVGAEIVSMLKESL